MSARRVAVFGGSFDPVHTGHLRMADRARRQVPVDEVWFLPAAAAPHKPRGPHVPAEARCRMIELALADRSGLALCRHEVDLGRPQRSVDTLEQLLERFEGVEFFFLMGEDSFRALDEWKQPQRLVELAPPVVQPRPGSAGQRPAQYAGQPVHWLEGEEMDVSSTELRQDLRRGDWERVAPRLPEAVLRFIETNGLYRQGGPS